MLDLASKWRSEKGDRKSYSQGDALCRVCRKVDESIDHIVHGCSKLAPQNECKRRHDKLGKMNKMYKHEPESVF